MIETTQPKKILFYVQHLLGIGHLKRTATLARSMMRAGLDVTVVSGGHEIDVDLGGARLIQLPATRATDLYFKVLVDEDGQQIDDEWRQKRANMLLDIYHEHKPDILITELFPFGRRQMRFEIEPLLEAARRERARRRGRPLIASSVRDILVEPDKPERIDEMVRRVRDYFDLVLVHGDPDFIAFDETFPRLRDIADLTHYTGYVAEPPPPPGGPGSAGLGEVIVSTGGGAVSEDMLSATIAARA